MSQNTAFLEFQDLLLSCKDSTKNLRFLQRISVSQAVQLAQSLLEEVQAGKLQSYLFADGIEQLICCIPNVLDGIEEAVFQHITPSFHSIAYLAANHKVRDSLLEQLAIVENKWLAEMVLNALAWIGDEVVRAKFIELSGTNSSLYKDTIFSHCRYSTTTRAGWELTSLGERRNLFYAESYELVPFERTHGNADMETIVCITPHEDKCGWCDLPLLTAVELNLYDQRFGFIGVPGERLKFALCQRCSQFETTFFQMDTKGKSTWFPLPLGAGSTLKDEPVLEIAPVGYAFGLRLRRSAYETLCYPFSPCVSQIGGFPTWLQGEQFPVCPTCKKTMMFVAQLTNADFPYPEGTIYLHFCPDCRVSAANFQQT